MEKHYREWAFSPDPGKRRERDEAEHEKYIKKIKILLFIRKLVRYLYLLWKKD